MEPSIWLPLGSREVRAEVLSVSSRVQGVVAFSRVCDARLARLQFIPPVSGYRCPAGTEVSLAAEKRAVTYRRRQ